MSILLIYKVYIACYCYKVGDAWLTMCHLKQIVRTTLEEKLYTLNIYQSINKYLVERIFQYNIF